LIFDIKSIISTAPSKVLTVQVLGKHVKDLPRIAAWCFRVMRYTNRHFTYLLTGAVRHARLQSNRHHLQTNTTQLLHSSVALCVAQPTVPQHWREKLSHSKDLLTPCLHGVFRPFPDH